jgi:hypothetical protein
LILRVYPHVDPAGHATQIVHDLGADQPPPTPTAVSSTVPAGQSTNAPKPSPGNSDLDE